MKPIAEEIKMILKNLVPHTGELTTRIIDQALSQILTLTKIRLPEKEILADIIFTNIYKDKKPKQEMGARLECLVLAEAILSDTAIESGSIIRLKESEG